MALAEAMAERDAIRQQAEEEREEVKAQLEYERGSVAALHKVINESLAKHMAVNK